MRFDLSSSLRHAEDFLRRHIKPKAVQEAEKRRRQRKSQAAARKFGRAVSVAGASGAGVAGYSLAIAPVGTIGLIAAGAAAVAAMALAASWPAPSRKGVSAEELAALVSDAEEWLLDKRSTLPGRAVPTLDPIFSRLADLHGQVERIEPSSTLAWDLRRLLADHLPRLVHSYSELPETVRQESPELLEGLIDGLATLNEELGRICREASRDHLLTFQAQERFIETRYREGSLKGK